MWLKRKTVSVYSDLGAEPQTSEGEHKMTLKEGELAPEVLLTGDNGQTLDLSAYKGKKNVVLYFYPKDSTPGCTKESVNFQASLDKIKSLDAEVIGVSPDSADSHRKFKDKYGLSFPLLADSDKKACRSFGVWAEKSMFGKKYWGVRRSTFIIGKDGQLKKIWPDVQVTGHAEEVITALEELNN